MQGQENMNFKARILIVDDRRSLVWFMERVLQKEGFDVLTAFDGVEGLRKIRDEKPDLVILDTIIPKKNGYEVFHYLRRNPDTVHMPVLFLTLKSAAEEKRIIESRINKLTPGLKNKRSNYRVEDVDFLIKPVSTTDMVTRVEALLHLTKIRNSTVKIENHKPRVLVIDDSRALVRLTEHALQKEGFDVLTAFDGLEGLRKARNEKPDLIVMDIIMPEYNGFQCLESVRQHSKVPVIMLTSDSELDSVQKALALGADDYVVKPFETRELLERIRGKLTPTTVPA